MARIYIAANYVTNSEPSAIVPEYLENSGHLQLVYEDDAGVTTEIEVQAPFLFMAGGNWSFKLREHFETTEYIDNNGNVTDPARYQSANIQLKEGQTAEQAWELLTKIHSNLSDVGADLDYDINTQNSNSYVNSMLYAIGLDLTQYISAVQPSDVERFPASNTNVFLAADNSASDNFDFVLNMNVAGTDGDDFIRFGRGSDKISGGEGSDILHGGDGNDFLFANGETGSEFTIQDGNLVFDENFAPWTVPGLSAIDYADGSADYLYGGNGEDYYFVAGQGGIDEFDQDRTIQQGFEWEASNFNKDIYDHIDIIYDSDGQGRIWYGLYGSDTGVDLDIHELGSHDFALNKDSNGQAVTFLGRQTWGSSIIVDLYTDPETGVSSNRLVFYEGETHHALFAIDGFFNGAFGITLEGYDPDTLYTPAGDYEDNINGGGGDENIDGGGGNDTIDGGEGNDTINGGEGDDVLEGGSGNDWIEGGSGADTISGGVGADTANYIRSDAGVSINLSAGTASGGHATGDQLQEIENLVGSLFDDTLTGDGEDNVFHGTEGADAIDGGAGSDTVSYKDYVPVGYSSSDPGLVINLMTGSVSGAQATGDVLTGIENITGTFADDQLTGDDNDNVLDGYAGTDTLLGNGGDDVLHIDSTTELAQSDGGTGEDTLVYSGNQTLNYNLADNGFEHFLASHNKHDRIHGTASANRIETGSGQNSLYGYEGDDTLIGGAGNDKLIGGVGSDILDGGEGSDRAEFTEPSGNAVIDLQAGLATHSNGDIDQLISIENVKVGDGQYVINGSSDANQIRVGQGDDTVNAGDGDDQITIDVLGGIDQFDGGAGNDRVDFQLFVGAVSVNLAIGLATGAGGYSASLASIESAYGSNDDDSITGSDGDNTLSGGDGIDVIVGAGGDDRIIIDEFDSWYSGGDGIDTVVYEGSADMQYSLSQGDFEHAEFGYGDDTIWGNALDNHIHGGFGDDSLFGYGGNDVLTGGIGSDILQGGDGDDRIIIDEDDSWYAGEAGIDTIVYTGHADILYALDQGAFENAEMGWGDDTIWGGSSDNVIDGGGENDTLFGYGGNDILIGGLGSDSLQGGDGDDRIIIDEDDSWYSGDAGIDTVVYAGLADMAYALDQGAFENAEMGAGDDTIWGGAADNIIDGGDGDDTLFGYGGNDTLIGGAGIDSLQGGDGDDFIFIDENDSWYSGDGGVDTIVYEGSADMQYALGQGGFENAEFGSGDDTIWATSDANDIKGGAGDDALFGYEGDDTLTGGEGDDTLSGGADDDVFIFRTDFGHDTVSDFDAGAGSEDIIEFSTDLFADYAAVLSAAADNNGDTVITVDTDNSITLSSVSVSALHVDDFQFVA